MYLFGLRKYVRACNWGTVERSLPGEYSSYIRELLNPIYETPCNWRAYDDGRP